MEFVAVKSFTQLALGARDIRDGFQLIRICLYFALSDTRARYRRTTLGPLWMVAATLIGVFGLGMLWSDIFKVERKTFIPALAVGFVVWQFISSTLIESTYVLQRNAGLIRNVPLPATYFYILNILRQLINFGHNLLAVIIIFFIFPPVLGAMSALSIIGIILLIGNLFCISVVLSIVGVRYRDLEHLVSASMPILFFLTPVIIQPSQLKSVEYLFAWNPLTHWIAIIREPLFGIIPDTISIMICFVTLLASATAALLLLSRSRSLIPFWV